MNGIDAMTVEHTEPSEKMRDSKGAPVCLSEYHKWPALGGPEAMQAEFDKPSVVPMCLNCQHMEPTHTAMQRLDPETLPTVSQSVDKATYMKKYSLVERHKKQAYVDDKKLKIGECAECWMKVVPRGSEYSPGHSAYPHMFQWAHRSELDKERSVSKIVNGTRSFNTAKPELDNEIGRCRMLCMNCGFVETQARRCKPGPSEEGN